MLRLDINSEQLLERVRTFSSTALENRQVASRLRELLPVRFMEMRRLHEQKERSVGHAERRALVDERFTKHLDELLEVSGSAYTARVEYETHVMLIQARQSLRGLTQRQNT